MTTRKLTVKEIQDYQRAVKMAREELEAAIREIDSIDELPDGNKGTCTGPTLRKLQAAKASLMEELMITTIDTLCVCGREHSNDTWKPVKGGLGTEVEARSWLRGNFQYHPEFTEWYIDRENNSEYPESYFELAPDGSLVEIVDAIQIPFARG